MSHADPPRTDTAQFKILKLLYDSFPGRAATLSQVFEAVRRQYSEEFDKALQDLMRSGLIEMVPYDDRPAIITHKGIRELAHLMGPTTVADLDNLNEIMLDGTAKVAESIEANKAEQERLSTELQRVVQTIETNKMEQEKLARKLVEVEDKLARSEREFYNRIVPFFAVFTAAFALILTGSQSLVRSNSLPSDNWQLFWQSAALMSPIGLLVLALVFLTWLLSRIR